MWPGSYLKQMDLCHFYLRCECHKVTVVTFSPVHLTQLKDSDTHSNDKNK